MGGMVLLSLRLLQYLGPSAPVCSTGTSKLEQDASEAVGTITSLNKVVQKTFKLLR